MTIIRMLSKQAMGGGALLVGVLLAAATYLKWPSEAYYALALLTLAWGAITLKG